MNSIKLKLISICSIVWFLLSGIIILVAAYWDNGLFFMGSIFSIIGSLLLVDFVSTEKREAERARLKKIKQNGVDNG